MNLKKGGKLLGEGTYGCVFSPPLLCKDDTQRLTGVGKTFTDSYAAEQEFDELKKLEIIDPNNKFTVQMSKMCNVPMQNIQESDEFNKCAKKKQGILVEYDQIILKDKGVDLFKFCSKPFKFSHLLDGFVNLANGLVQFEKHKICHRDIKPMNIIVMNNNEMKYIDFGLAKEYKDLYNNENYYILSHPYIYYPPEFDLYSNYMMHTDDYNFESIFTKYKHITSRLNNIGLNQNTLKTQFEYLISHSKDKVEYTQFTQNKIDVFSLGVTMLETFYTNNANTNDLNDTQKTLIQSVITNSINFDPIQRLTPSLLYSNLKAIKNAKNISIQMKISKSPVTSHKMSKDYCRKFFTIKELQHKAKEFKSKNINKNSLNKKIVKSGTKDKLCENIKEFLEEKSFSIPVNNVTQVECSKQYTLKQLKEKATQLKQNNIHINRQGNKIISSGRKDKIVREYMNF